MIFRFALFIHLLALVAASAASGIVHVAEARFHAATRADEARFWRHLTSRTARAFPIALLVLVATGAWMMRAGWPWSSGWVIAGLVGSAFLFVSGGLLGARGVGVGRALASMDGSAPWSHPSRGRSLERMQSWANTGVAMAVVYVMVTKPALVGALVALVVGALIGVTVSATSRA